MPKVLEPRKSLLAAIFYINARFCNLSYSISLCRVSLLQVSREWKTQNPEWNSSGVFKERCLSTSPLPVIYGIPGQFLVCT